MIDKLQKFIEENIDLIDAEDWAALFSHAGELTLQLIHTLHDADIDVSSHVDEVEYTNNEFWKNVIVSFLVITGTDTTGYFGGDKTEYDEHGFYLYSQAADMEFSLNTDTKDWRLYSTNSNDPSEEFELSLEGRGWDNFVYNVYEHGPELGFFEGTDWKAEDCYVGDQKKYPLTLHDIVYCGLQDD